MSDKINSYISLMMSAYKKFNFYEGQ